MDSIEFHPSNNINSFIELQNELQNYIQLSSDIEKANLDLTIKVEDLEKQLIESKNETIELLNTAKASFRTQAIAYGKKQKELAKKEVLNDDKDNLTITNNDKISYNTIIKLNMQLQESKHETLVQYSVSNYPNSHFQLILQDFDLTDCHCSIKNRTKMSMSLKGYSLRFRNLNLFYRFPDDICIKGNHKISLWWGNNQLYRRSNINDSLYWSNDLVCRAANNEIVELVYSTGKVSSIIGTNQSAYLDIKEYNELSKKKNCNIDETNNEINNIAPETKVVQSLSNRKRQRNENNSYDDGDDDENNHSPKKSSLNITTYDRDINSQYNNNSLLISNQNENKYICTSQPCLYGRNQGSISISIINSPNNSIIINNSSDQPFNITGWKLLIPSVNENITSLFKPPVIIFPSNTWLTKKGKLYLISSISTNKADYISSIKNESNDNDDINVLVDGKISDFFDSSSYSLHLLDNLNQHVSFICQDNDVINNISIFGEKDYLTNKLENKIENKKRIECTIQ
jgi:hypothetical protein